ncbi:hypothetical protein [Neobacillus mesonae]|uniref:Uncharacterized protein n=1 Tax=Neobacillus mesonae TaxID=1193713 RepID=A0A3Q9QV58_9BACI|nr:hypothetical protein [Neobacillus mesonae]AZU61049.1 hypothetical protein CHR53_07165 [Neobacillus mesonae]
MGFEPLNLASRGGNSLTIDKFRRIRLSSSALKALALTNFTPVVVSVDVENKRVGIVKQELAKIPNASVVRPDKRGYLGIAAGKMVADKLALTDDDLPAKFSYVGKVDEGSVFWHGFELVRAE